MVAVETQTVVVVGVVILALPKPCHGEKGQSGASNRERRCGLVGERGVVKKILGESWE